MSKDAEVVIAGAGVAGSSMAIVLARLGIAVLLLEKSSVHVDRIRGEVGYAVGRGGSAKTRIT